MLVSCRLFSWPALGGITELMMPQQWWIAAVAVPSAVSIIMTREREAEPCLNEACWRKTLRLSGENRNYKSREVNYYLFWEDKTGFRQPSVWLSLINTLINTVFITSTNRSLDWLILSKASQNLLPGSKTHSSCEKESEIADSFGSMTAP